ncbi:MAG: ribosome silencing factor [Pseudohongiellaceae bacterium]
MESKKLSKLVIKALEDMKGQSIVCLDVRRLTQITDYMVVVTGTSTTHIRALADKVIKDAKAASCKVTGIEGREQSEWVLVDLGGVVVHIMLAPVRALYKLEDLWNFSPSSNSEPGP